MIDPFTPHRSLLFGIAYRMLGRVVEAEDMVQETWLRWQRQDTSAIKSSKAWLVSTVTRLCIDQLRAARHQREEYYGVWLPEPLVGNASVSPADSAALADSLSMAFMLMLETLTPLERAVFLLREVFDFDYSEIGAIVDKTPTYCRQIVRRAKTSLRPESMRASSAPPGDRARQIVERFLVATSTGRIGDLLALLTEDAILYTDGGGVVQSAGRPIRSADHISRFFAGIRRRMSSAPEIEFISLNGQPGAALRLSGRIDRILSFDFEGERIRTVYLIRNPEKLRHLAPFDSSASGRS